MLEIHVQHDHLRIMLFCPCGGKQVKTRCFEGWMAECSEGCGLKPIVAGSYAELMERWNSAVMDWEPRPRMDHRGESHLLAYAN